MLANDAISNYRTVAGFGLCDLIVNEYQDLTAPTFKKGLVTGHFSGMAFGFGKFIENVIFGVLIYFGTLFMINDSSIQGEDMFVAQFAIVFGAFGAGQATSYGPDTAKAKEAAIKVLKIVDTPTMINAVDIKEGSRPIPENFRGEIEFKNVWFRYPMRPNQWVFKGLNLKINPQDQIAIVGESGQGKSTFILVLMRFYDVEFGEVLIDGVNIKEYNIQELRRRMGLVMQEPTLFNYSIKENILYGNQKASNADLVEAANISNSLGFI